MNVPTVRAPLLYQRYRQSDGIRGVFLKRSVPTGTLLMRTPVSSCYFPKGLTTLQRSASDYNNNSILHGQQSGDCCRELRRANRASSLFPEGWVWLQRFSPDAAEDTVSLTASVSDDSLLSSASGQSSVVTLCVSPVEAMLAVCIGLRYFYKDALGISASAREQVGLGPRPSEYAERYVKSLPMQEYLSLGVESLYGADGEEAGAHACLEQIACNIRDACLSVASTEEYRLLDGNPSTLDAVLLAALYVVRSRVVSVPLLAPIPQARGGDRLVSVFAPGLDCLNHAHRSERSAAAALSVSQGVLVVRATRPLRAGEEVTISYHAEEAAQGRRESATVADGWWQSRYLMGGR